MAKGRLKGMVTLVFILAAAGIGAYWLSRPEPIPPVAGVVRSTEVRIAPEVAGQLATGKRWLSFNVREDMLHGLTVGTMVQVANAGTHEVTPAVVTELRPLGAFATWQAERAVGDHDRNTLRLRVDLQADSTGLESGMTVRINR